MGFENDEVLVLGADAALIENLSFSLGRHSDVMLNRGSPLVSPQLRRLEHSFQPAPIF